MECHHEYAEEGEERTHAGLYLPQTATAARQAAGGWVVSVGPGVPVINPMDMGDEPWHEHQEARPHYVPMQAQEGDYVLYMRKAAVEITFEKRAYLIVPNSAVLVLVREDFETESQEWTDGGSEI